MTTQTIDTYFLLDTEFNSEYGDVVLVNDDFALVNNRKIFLTNYIQEKLKTNLGEIFNLPEYGADIGFYIGRGINQSIIDDIRTSISKALTKENILQLGDFTVYILAKENELYIRVVIETSSTTLSVGLNANKEGITIA